ncbi:UDP-N-acetylglucosamine--undecaprenyl-phosphate N-acetylglucosaminephosphotransferase [Erwinia sp. S43]|uniref:UDP-N-acetylglucosamine--undecaprenyl-phosphate N-acetylglucosaminephosphotransferase n=1 Tax=unclassified Erwinia TaxID=2622719 RepID=UPI00190913A7|nr:MULTISPECIES: UDP-N-acetylglucosamine--undecaprenyl-phosphate N-acetylglucosaminephosphotransferase [unclassified Erwinia]MBK0002128.1 UDP-N-acetylglucosamine--undecaprenyl-phosphate N-acetylglucosaminephosphotransferase [Erwinia sp. S38]MBK0033527.1 UDP-N-acetylglucosamine--undecaprenyl-phosphate N-acetylglucosaminephosphotransferase [Erwinia sp. S43]
MQEIVLIFLGALALLFIARKIARKVGLVDKPNARKHHSGHIPLVGGVSVYFSLWILYALQPAWLPDFDIYMICATLLLLVGVLDDRFDLPVMPRMGLQAAVAGIMMYNGLYLSSLGNILFGYQLILGTFGYVITLFAVIAAINAFNMVDGIDGLLGALSCVTFGSLGIVFIMGGNDDMAMWCMCLMAACLPYILLNLGIPWGRKFKVFMGDAGSMLIGFTVIWLLIVASQGQDAIMSPVTALWLIAVPLMDMMRVMIARIRRGSSPFRPDREHMHHILMRAGLSGRWTLVIMTSAQVFSGMIGIILEGCRVPDNWQLALFVGSFISLLYAMKSLERLKVTFGRFLAVK